MAEPSIVPDDATKGSERELAHEWACLGARAAATKTDEPIEVLDVGAVMAIVDYFVITSGRNGRQVKTIAEEVEEKIAVAGGPKPHHIEGLDSLQWVLMDYGDFLVHVFLNEMREFYSLERLWSDVPRVDWQHD